MIWRETLRDIESGAVTLSLHRDFVPPGDYTVRVRSGKAEATFLFRVTER